MRCVAIIQARMGSSRLPGKVLKPILGRPMLELLIGRVGECRRVDRIVVATTDDSRDDAIADCVRRMDDVGLFRGSEENVLERFFEAASKFDADLIMRVTADNPFFDWQLADTLIETCIEGGYDYVSSGLTPSFPYGIGAEVFTKDSFRRVYEKARSAYEKEHVTPCYYQNPDMFRLGQVTFHRDVSNVRLTVDTPEDFDRASELFDRYGERVTFREIIDEKG